jgi:hypothetical protein
LDNSKTLTDAQTDAKIHEWVAKQSADIKVKMFKNDPFPMGMEG